MANLDVQRCTVLNPQKSLTLAWITYEKTSDKVEEHKPELHYVLIKLKFVHIARSACVTVRHYRILITQIFHV